MTGVVADQSRIGMSPMDSMNEEVPGSEEGVRSVLDSRLGVLKIAIPTMMAQTPPKKVKSRFSAWFAWNSNSFIPEVSSAGVNKA